jgi:hypothetical protein
MKDREQRINLKCLGDDLMPTETSIALLGASCTSNHLNPSLMLGNIRIAWPKEVLNVRRTIALHCSESILSQPVHQTQLQSQFRRAGGSVNIVTG